MPSAANTDKKMSQQSISFNKVGDEWVAKFDSPGTFVMQLERRERGTIGVAAYINGLVEVPIASFQNPYSPSAIFEVDIPAGVWLAIRSESEVIQAEIITS